MKLVNALRKRYNEFIRSLTFGFIVLVMPIDRLMIFLKISVTLLIFKGSTDEGVEIDMNKFLSLINTNYSTGAIEFPHHTLDIMWGDAFLNSVQDCKEGSFRIKDLISSKELLINNLDDYVEHTMTSLPFLFKLRLGISERSRYVKVKKELADIIQQRHQPQQI